MKKSDKEKYIISLICRIYKKGTNELIYKAEIRVPDIENKLKVTGVREGQINWETGIDIYTLMFIKQVTNKDLLYSTGNSIYYSVVAYMGKES